MNASDQHVALVSGANRGIGFAVARELARRNLKVVIGCRDENKGEQARRLLAEHGEVYDTLLDVTDATSIQAALGKITDTFGRLDVLVNNAGIQIDGETTVLELAPTTLLNTLETNALGPLLLSQACIPLMKANGYGRIVNVSSVLGSLNDTTNPFPGSRGYRGLAGPFRSTDTRRIDFLPLRLPGFAGWQQGHGPEPSGPPQSRQ